MSAEDDLLNSFFAEINSLPTPASSEQPKVEEVGLMSPCHVVENCNHNKQIRGVCGS
jgi:hypothetical protein